ncbi:hypothetical protein M5E88_00540 [Akkermansia muciniphila]|nr:hypothetical protein M5E88_00540 [Akkermansia muciniphila]
MVGSAAFAIQARRGEGAWTPVGKRNAGPGVSEFAIPAGTSAVRLTYKAPQPEAIINEVIFPPGNNRLRRWRLTPNSVRNEPGGVFLKGPGARRADCFRKRKRTLLFSALAVCCGNNLDPVGCGAKILP